MSIPNPEAPKTLAQAEEQFKTFLAANRYPQTICWITSKDLVVSAPHEYSVRKPTGSRAKDIDQKFVEGLAKGVGVELRAICASDNETFATIFVPADQTDAQYHLMGGELKMSCPAERPNARVIGNPLKWLLLSQKDSGRSGVLFG